MKSDPVTFEPQRDPASAETHLATARDATKGFLQNARKRVVQFRGEIKKELAHISVYEDEIRQLDAALAKLRKR